MEKPAFEQGPEETSKYLEEHWQDTGSLEMEGVSDQEKRVFAEQRLRRIQAEMSRLDKERLELERVYAQLNGGLPFTPQEKAWFAQGEDPNRMLLQESWETTGSLDVDEDVPDAEKYAFAVSKLKQLQEAYRSSPQRFSRIIKEKIAGLELLVRQYAPGKG